MTDAITRKEAAAIFGVTLKVFDEHVRQHLVERKFGRHPRYSRAEAEELWRRGGPVAPSRNGVARPPYLAPSVPQGRASTPLRAGITEEARRRLAAKLTPRQRIMAELASPEDIERVRYLDERKAQRAALRDVDPGAKLPAGKRC